MYCTTGTESTKVSGQFYPLDVRLLYFLPGSGGCPWGVGGQHNTGGCTMCIHVFFTLVACICGGVKDLFPNFGRQTNAALLTQEVRWTSESSSLYDYDLWRAIDRPLHTVKLTFHKHKRYGKGYHSAWSLKNMLCENTTAEEKIKKNKVKEDLTF